MEWCKCGFNDRSVALDEIPERVELGIADLRATLMAAGETASQRPSRERWSSLEYAAHVRDVMLLIRDRLVIGLVEDYPSFQSLYRDERVDLGLYRTDTPAAVIAELESAGAMFLRLFASIDADSMSRQVQYGNPQSTTRTLGWMGKQVVHETEHHISDMKENNLMMGKPRQSAGPEGCVDKREA